MRWLLIGGLAALGTARAGVAQTDTTLGGRSAVVWWPATSAGRAPLAVFSHGFSGCARQSTFLTQALAARGYVVVAPNHKDARCDGQGRGGLSRPEEPFRDPQAWSDATFADRRDDVRAVVQALRDGPSSRDRIDFDRIALVGHSLGGYTVVGLAGGWTTWRLPGVKAVLALSPYVEPFAVDHTLAALGVPVMYQGGTLDLGITPSLRRPGGAYEQSSAPKFFVEFTRAGHFAWTNLRAEAHERILNYALPFLDRYVRGLSPDNRLTTKAGGVSDLRFDTTATASSARR